MRLSDILAICVRNLTRRKLRTFLTALGVVIGVGLIIIAISIGIGLTQAYEEQLASWGDLTVIEVYNWNSTKMHLHSFPTRRSSDLAFRCRHG